MMEDNPEITRDLGTVLIKGNEIENKTLSDVRNRIAYVNFYFNEFGNPPCEGIFLLIVTEGVPRYWFRIQKQEDSIVIGRLEDCDIMLEHENVSRRHATIEKDNNNVFTLTDLDSKNGTFVNDKRITSHELCDGDIIRIANNELIFVKYQLNP